MSEVNTQCASSVSLISAVASLTPPASLGLRTHPILQSSGLSTRQHSASINRALPWTLHASHKKRGPGQARERALGPEAEAAVLAGLEDDAVGTPWRAQAAGTPAALAAAVRCAGATTLQCCHGVFTPQEGGLCCHGALPRPH
jgi:hypothetical protein